MQEIDKEINATKNKDHTGTLRILGIAAVEYYMAFSGFFLVVNLYSVHVFWYRRWVASLNLDACMTVRLDVNLSILAGFI